jgi:hypothetical protein
MRSKVANKAAAPNRRPCFPFVVLRGLGYCVCDPPARSAAVGEPNVGPNENLACRDCRINCAKLATPHLVLLAGFSYAPQPWELASFHRHSGVSTFARCPFRNHRGPLWSFVAIERVSCPRGNCGLCRNCPAAAERWVFPSLRGNVFCVLGLDAVRARPVFRLVERLNKYWSNHRGCRLRDTGALHSLRLWPGAAVLIVSS